MKFKAIFFLFIFFAFLSVSQGDTTGYLSFEYIKGQDKSEVHQGTFKNAQLGIIFSGVIARGVDYTAEARTKEAKIEIEQAWVKLKTSEAFSLSIGLYLVPFGRYNQSNRPHQTMLINPPFNVEEMYPSCWKDLGILMEGKFSSVFYSAYLGNGLAEKENLEKAQQFEDNNKDKAKGGRIGLSLSQELTVAYSYYKGKYDEMNSRNLTIQGADLAWITEGLLILCEYSKARLENPEPYSSGKAEGYFVQVSFDMGKLRPVVSYQCLKYKDSFHGIGFIEPLYPGGGISEDKSRWSLGLVYFPSPRLLFKIEYDFNREKDFELKNDTFFAQVALSF